MILSEAKKIIHTNFELPNAEYQICVKQVWEYPLGWFFIFGTNFNLDEVEHIQKLDIIFSTPAPAFVDKKTGTLKQFPTFIQPYYTNLSFYIRDYAQSKGYEWKVEWEIDVLFLQKSNGHHIFES
jgi:hypothetical protein